MKLRPPSSTSDLLSSERRFVAAMQKLGFGHFERLQVRNGQLILDPWPTTVRSVKFCSGSPSRDHQPIEFELKKQLVEFFGHVRGVQAGEIRILGVQAGLPFSMQIEECHEVEQICP